MSTVDISEAFDEEQGDNRPACYYEGDTLIIRASAIGNSCLFELVATAQEYEPVGLPANILRAFEEGKKIEPVVIRRLQTDHDFIIHSKQMERELILPNNIHIRFHPDAVASWPRYPNVKRWVVEVKALGDSLWQRAVRGSVGDTIDEYEWQLSVMMLGLGMPGLWVPYNKGKPPDEETGIRPFCKHEKAIYLEPVFDPPIDLDTINEKAQHIKELVDGEDILETGQECGDSTHWPCRFQHLKPESEGSGDNGTQDGLLKVEGGTNDAEEIDRLVREYLFNKGQADECKAKADDTRDEIIRLSGGAKRIQTEKWLIPIVNGSNSSYDFTEMPYELKEALKVYKKRTRYKYLRGIKNLGEE